MIEAKHISMALDVRRGQRRIRELAEEDRAPVSTVLRRTSDAELAQVIEGRKRQRERAFIAYRPRVASLRG